jgi:hypothetical protein
VIVITIVTSCAPMLGAGPASVKVPISSSPFAATIVKLPLAATVPLRRQRAAPFQMGRCIPEIPALTFDSARVIVAQAVLWDTEDRVLGARR